MNLTSVICDYLYGAFQIIRASIEALVALFETTIDKIYSIATNINLMITKTLSKALDAIVLVIANTLEGLLNEMNNGLGSSKWCANAFKCNFLLEEILDPDSLIAKTIRKILEGKNDCYCVNKAGEEISAVRNAQNVLFEIATDYEAFKTQICNGLSLDMGVDMTTDLFMGFKSKLNKWRRKFQGLIDYLKRQLQNLLDKFRDSKLFQLLTELKAFFQCVIDSELCANVDTAKSFYQSVLKKLGLVEAGPNEWLFSPEIEQEIISVPRGFLSRIDDISKKMDGILRKLANPSGIKGVKNTLDLVSHVKGVISLSGDVINDRELNYNKIPIIDYKNKKINEIYESYLALHGKNTNDPDTALSSNYCVTLNTALMEYKANGATEEFLLVEPGFDATHANDLIVLDEKIWTVSDAAKQIFQGVAPRELLNHIKEVAGFLNVDDILVRYS